MSEMELDRNIDVANKSGIAHPLLYHHRKDEGAFLAFSAVAGDASKSSGRDSGERIGKQGVAISPPLI